MTGSMELFGEQEYRQEPLSARTPPYNSAVISECGRYRYLLERRWGAGRLLPFIMLNPSTADAEEDDPTIRRCIRFAQREGFDGIRVANLYAYRATDPKELGEAGDRFGPDNNLTLIDLARYAHENSTPIVCAWGANEHAPYGAATAMEWLTTSKLVCFGTTMSGAPRHPLYLRSDQPLVPFGHSAVSDSIPQEDATPGE